MRCLMDIPAGTKGLACIRKLGPAPAPKLAFARRIFLRGSYVDRRKSRHHDGYAKLVRS